MTGPRTMAYGPCDNGPLITADMRGLCRIWDCTPRPGNYKPILEVSFPFHQLSQPMLPFDSHGRQLDVNQYAGSVSSSTDHSKGFRCTQSTPRRSTLTRLRCSQQIEAAYLGRWWEPGRWGSFNWSRQAHVLQPVLAQQSRKHGLQQNLSGT